MGFGNPYGDAWSPELVTKWSERLYKELGINILALSDTIGVANPEIITDLFTTLIPALPEVEFGAHLHSTPTEYAEKVKSAYEAGCRRFDGAIKGFGGCPMAKDDLTGNMPTEGMLHWFDKHGIATGLDLDAFRDSLELSLQVFPV